MQHLRTLLLHPRVLLAFRPTLDSLASGLQGCSSSEACSEECLETTPVEAVRPQVHARDLPSPVEPIPSVALPPPDRQVPLVPPRPVVLVELVKSPVASVDGSATSQVVSAAEDDVIRPPVPTPTLADPRVSEPSKLVISPTAESVEDSTGSTDEAAAEAEQATAAAKRLLRALQFPSLDRREALRMLLHFSPDVNHRDSG
eukprot:RCo041176